MEENTRKRGCSSFADGGFANTREVFMLLGDKGEKKQHVDPEVLVLSLTRLRDHLVKRGEKEISLPVYDQNRRRLHPWDLYAQIHIHRPN